jgi:hypothetical protein
MAFQTLAQMLTSLQDGGANTAAEVRTIIDGIVRQKIWAPYSNDHAEDVFWQSNLSDFTDVVITGSHTLIERDGFLSVRFTGIASGDVNCRLKARTFTVGDEFACRIRLGGLMNDFSMAGLFFTDGTTATSNAVGAAAYITSTATSLILVARHGTLQAFASDALNVSILNEGPLLDGLYAKLQYTASNSFRVYFSADGVSWSEMGTTAFSKTMTPTHFGVGWSKEGGSGDGVASFGPICRLA